MKKIGSLWKGKTKDGKTYLRGEVEVVAGLPTKVMIFQVKEKKNVKGPDYEVVLNIPAKVPFTPQSDRQIVSEEDL